MQNPFDQFDEAEQNPFDQFDLVNEGGPQANYGAMTPREAVDAMPGFLTRTPFEKQNDHLRNRLARDAELAELGLTGDRTESAAIGAYDGLSLGNYATERSSKALYPSYASMPFGAQVAGALDKQGILPEWAGGGQAKAQEDALRLFQKRQTEARAENPWSYMGGEIGGYLAPGGGVLSTGSKVAKGIGHATLKKELAMKGSGPIARGTRYLQSSVAPAAIAGGVDYGVYEATVGESARAAEEGRTASLGDRADAFGEGVTSPEGYLFGAAASPIYRAGRGVASVATGGRVSMTPLPQKQWAANLGQGNTPQARAYRMVAKRLKQDGVSTDQLRKAISNYHYAGYSTVDEMLFELAEASTQDKGGGKLKQLAVALGSVGGDAQQTARANFNARKAEMPTRFREELRRAVGLEGSDFYQYGQQIENLQRTLPKPLYDSAYAKSISDQQWQGEVWPGLQTKPASQQAIVEAYDYARNVGELEVAREIAELLPGIGRALDERTGQVVRAGAEQSAAARRNLPAKPSTQALDYIDRMLGDTAESLRSPATRRTELAKGPAGAQASLRSVVDDATGLNEGRDKAAELFAARDALDFGVKGFERGIDLETLQNEFARKSGRYGGEHIDPALLMGWIKGAENAIDKATNPGTVMRQIYGSERQRAKLLSMLPDGAELGPGGKGDKTKRRRVLVGGKRSDGSVVDGRFDRAGRMLASENEIVGNSQTGQRNEAIAEQGGLQRLANTVADAVLDPRQTINKGLRAGINRATRPGIFNEKVNRELGEIMFTGGRDNLNRIVDELDNLQRKPPAKLPMKGSGGGAGAVAANMPAKRAASNGLPMLNNTPVMMGAGAGSGAVVDYDGDGEITARDMAIGAAIGAAPKAARMADDVITSPSARRVLDGSSGAGFTNPGRTGETIYAKSGRKYSMAEGSTMSKVIELARQGKTNTQIDEALGLSPGVAAHYRNVAKTGKPPVDLSKVRNERFADDVQRAISPENVANSRPGQMGIGNTAGGAVLGGIGGGSMAQDLDGDGRVSMQERYAQGTLGALAGGLGGRAVGKLDDRMISQGSRQVLEGGSVPKRPLPTPDELAAAEAEVIRTSQELEPLQRAWSGPGVSNANDRRILDAATQKNQQALVKYYDMRDSLEAAQRSGGKPLPTPDELAAAEAEVIRTSKALEPLQRSWNGPGVSNANDRRALDAATQENQRALVKYYDMRDRLEAATRSTNGGGVNTNGIGGRRRKDMLKDVMPDSQGARVPGTSKPLPMKGKDAPAAPAYRDDLTTAGVVGLPLGGAAGLYAYSMYKAEMYKRGQKDVPSFQEFMKMIEEEQRSRMGVPPRPGVKPNLPQRVQG